MPHGLDTDTEVFFYEQEFYVLSNFSSFQLTWSHKEFPTSEHAYHWEKFRGHPDTQQLIQLARSAHDAFHVSRAHADQIRPDWTWVKLDVMRAILEAKAWQHTYVMRKLLETGARKLVENSWRDPYWGTGPDGNGRNALGRLWMNLRHEFRSGARTWNCTREAGCQCSQSICWARDKGAPRL